MPKLLTHHPKGYLLPENVLSDAFKCTQCTRNISAVTSKITTNYYGNALCSWCECDLIDSGFWTPEKLAEHKRNRNLHNISSISIHR